MRAYKVKLQIAEYVDDIPEDEDLEDIDRMLGEIEFTVQVDDKMFCLDASNEETESSKPDDTGRVMEVLAADRPAYFIKSVSSWNVMDGELYIYGVNSTKPIATFAAGKWIGIVPPKESRL